MTVVISLTSVSVCDIVYSKFSEYQSFSRKFDIFCVMSDFLDTEEEDVLCIRETTRLPCAPGMKL